MTTTAELAGQVRRAEIALQQSDLVLNAIEVMRQNLAPNGAVYERLGRVDNTMQITRTLAQTEYNAAQNALMEFIESDPDPRGFDSNQRWIFYKDGSDRPHIGSDHPYPTTSAGEWRLGYRVKPTT